MVKSSHKPIILNQSIAMMTKRSPNPLPRKPILLSVLLLLLGWLLPSGAGISTPYAPRTTIAVTTNADEFDESGTGSGCGLREAIQTANTGSDFGGCARSGSGVPAIYIPPETYALTRHGSGEDDNVTGDLDIHVSVGLYGAGKGTSVIKGDGYISENDRVFHIVQEAASDFLVTMWDLTITEGYSGNTDGGGILNEESLWVSRVDIHHNATLSNGAGVASEPAHTGQGFRAYLSSSIYSNSTGHGLGGGIYISAGELVLDHAELAGGDAIYGGGLYLAGGTTDIAWTIMHVNKARGDGGGIYLAGGEMTLADSSIYYNSTDGNGGNIYLANSANASSINRCYIGEGQTADGLGAGIYNAGELTISSSTVALNTRGRAAGIYHNPTASTGVMLTILDSTIANNNTAAPAGQMGEGLYNAQNLTNIQIRNTLFSDNGNSVSNDDNCFSGWSPSATTSIRVTAVGSRSAVTRLTPIRCWARWITTMVFH
jgi:CSLREA domain-containing protein